MSQNKTDFEKLRDLLGDPYYSFKNTFLEINRHLQKGLVLTKDKSLEIKRSLEEDTLSKFINRHLFLSKSLIKNQDFINLRNHIIKIEYMESFLCEDDEVYLIPLIKNSNGTYQKSEDLSELIYQVDFFFSFNLELNAQTKFIDQWNTPIDGIWIKIVSGNIRKELVDFYNDIHPPKIYKELIKPESFFNRLYDFYGYDRSKLEESILLRSPLWGLNFKNFLEQNRKKPLNVLKSHIDKDLNNIPPQHWGFNDVLELSLFKNELINLDLSNERLISQVQILKKMAQVRMDGSLEKFSSWNGL